MHQCIKAYGYSQPYYNTLLHNGNDQNFNKIETLSNVKHN